MSLPTGYKAMPENSAPTLQSQSIINLEDVSVEYRVPQEQIGTFKEYTIRLLEGKVKHRVFKALNGINLSVNQGEVFGFIGQNGAGKSTLLKLVARVLASNPRSRSWFEDKLPLCLMSVQVSIQN